MTTTENRLSILNVVGGVCGGVIGSLLVRQLSALLGPLWGGIAALAFIPLTLVGVYFLTKE